jgi:predicted RNA-binding Zn ribbon-like protein
MRPATAKPPLFDLCGGHPALDFVNSLDDRFTGNGPVERLAEYGDLLRFAQQSGLLDAREARRLAGCVPKEAAARALRSALQLREALASVLYCAVDGRPPADGDIRTLEQHFHDASRHRELRWDRAAQSPNKRAGLEWHWGRFSAHAELPVWTLALAARQLTTSDALERVRACGAESCRWLFLDTSKNRTRRWCKMQVCGNRMKAKRFQARHA